MTHVAVIGLGLASYGVCKYLLTQDDLTVDIYDIAAQADSSGIDERHLPNSAPYQGSYFLYGANDKRTFRTINTQRMCSSHASAGYSLVYSGSAMLPFANELTNWPNESLPSSSDITESLAGISTTSLCGKRSSAFPIDHLASHPPSKSYSYCFKSRLLQDSPTVTTPFTSTSFFRSLSSNSKYSIHSGIEVLRIEKCDKNYSLSCFELATACRYDTGAIYSAVFIAAGCINTTAIVDASLNCQASAPRRYSIISCPFHIIPTISLGFLGSLAPPPIHKGPRYFIEHSSSLTSGLNSHTQISSIRSEMKDLLFSATQASGTLSRLVDLLFSPFSYSLSVFHSTLGAQSSLTARLSFDNEVPVVTINESQNKTSLKAYLSIYLALLTTFFRHYQLPLPWLPLLTNRLKGNSLGGWHFGGTIPFSVHPQESECKPNGELPSLPSVFVCDTSAFPSIPGSTVAALTIANAYRIARSYCNTRLG